MSPRYVIPDFRVKVDHAMCVIHKVNNPEHLVIVGMLMWMVTVARLVQVIDTVVPFPG